MLFGDELPTNVLGDELPTNVLHDDWLPTNVLVEELGDGDPDPFAHPILRSKIKNCCQNYHLNIQRINFESNLLWDVNEDKRCKGQD